MFQYEQGNVSQFGGIHSCQIPNLPDGTFSLEKLLNLLRPDDIHYPITKLVCVENTHNRCGGRILPLDWLEELAVICEKWNVPIHMDGARIFNASVASGIPVSRICRDVASVSVCLSKGLGSPAGSVIVGRQQFIEQARRMRKALGGGIRQNGIISAAGIYCLDNMIQRMTDDHENAKLIGKILNEGNVKGLKVDTDSIQTNILFLEMKSGNLQAFIERLAKVGEGLEEQEERKWCEGKTTTVRCFPCAANKARLVTHCDVDREMVRRAALKILYVANKLIK